MSIIGSTPNRGIVSDETKATIYTIIASLKPLPASANLLTETLIEGIRKIRTVIIVVISPNFLDNTTSEPNIKEPTIA